MYYVMQPLTESICINSIVSIHYFEYSKDFTYDGESHPFWELVYVDRGVIDILAGDERKTVSQGEIVFHAPDEFHTIICNGKDVANTAIITFDTNDEGALLLTGVLKKLSNGQKKSFASVMNAGMEVFEGPYDIPFVGYFKKKKNLPFGAEQNFKNLLELFLIDVIRSLPTQNKAPENNPADLKLDSIADFLETNLKENYTLEEISRRFGMSKSALNRMYKSKYNVSPIRYHNMVKMKRAKDMLREERYTVSEIADLLGFASVHYFSRYFKKMTGQSPKAYAQSVRAKLYIDDVHIVQKL